MYETAKETLMYRTNLHFSTEPSPEHQIHIPRFLNSHTCLLDTSILICSKLKSSLQNVYLLQCFLAYKNEHRFWTCSKDCDECWQASLIRGKNIKIQKGHLGIWSRKLQSKNCQQYRTLIKCVPTHSLKTMCHLGIQINLFGHRSKPQ